MYFLRETTSATYTVIGYSCLVLELGCAERTILSPNRFPRVEG